MHVEYQGEVIDFGDTPAREIEAFFRSLEQKEKQAEFDALADAIASREIDYSDDFKALGDVLSGIRDRLDREEKDYSPEFSTIVDAVKAVELPETVDLSPVVDAVRSINTEVDVSGLQASLDGVSNMVAQLVRKDTKLVLPAEKRREVKALKIHRNSAGNADTVDLIY